MNPFIKFNVIDEMNTVIQKYVDEKKLFCGGCCYSAYVLAKNLTKLGIKYKTVIVQYDEILNANTFNDAINGRGVAHVAIKVCDILKGNVFIGDFSDLTRYFNHMKYAYNIKSYDNISPEEILKGYKNGRKAYRWNYIYDVKNNAPLMKEINQICKKYLK